MPEEAQVVDVLVEKAQDAPVEVSAEGVPNAQNTAEQAPATPTDETPSETPEQAAKRQGRRFERRYDKAIRRAAEAEARAKLLEEQVAKYSQQQQQPESGAPKLEDFTDLEEFRKAVEKHASEKTAKDIEAKSVQARQKQYVETLSRDWAEKVGKVEDKYDDYDEVVGGDLKPESALAVAIMEADNGPDIAYYLAKHKDELIAIAKLSPVSQARAIGRLEAKLLSEPAKPKQPSKAPAPITPVGGGSGAANEMPSDKDDITSWMRKENERMRKLAH